MLAPADIIAAKLLVQLGWAEADFLAGAMRVSDEDGDLSRDLLARLAEVGRLSASQVARARRYVAMFEYVRREAVTLRILERNCPELSRDEVIALLARIERDRYRRRLLAVLVDAGRLDLERAKGFDAAARERILREDHRVLERYRADGFAGVARPLLPTERIDTGVFHVTELFRSPSTVRYVKEAVRRLLDSEPAPAPTAPAGQALELVPVELPVPAPPEAAEAGGAPRPGEAVALEPEEELPPEARAHLETARWKREPTPDPSAGLEARERIGAYEVVECLGQGGMGAVYLAQEEGLGPMVAVKVVLAEKADADQLARFRREAEICALLAHPNLVHLIERGRTEDGLDYMVLPFFVGRDLKALLSERGLLEPAFAFDIVEQLLAGLSAAHRARVVHRDLKPENVFVLSGTQEVKLVDFGIARLVDPTRSPAERLYESRAGVISGSPAYVAPETIAGEPIDGRTDIYSLGVLFYQLLTGVLPLVADSPYEFLNEHLVGVPRTLAQGRRDRRWLPELEELLARMLAKAPTDRPASCEEVLSLLRGGLRERALAELARPPEEPDEPGEDSLFNSFFKMLRG